MKSKLKFLSAFLAFVMILSVVFAAPFTASALTGHGWYPVSQASSYNYSLWNIYNNYASSTVGISDYSVIPEMQSIDSLEQDGYLIRKASPYVAYIVIAPEEGDYSLNPVYQVATTSGTVPYNMTIGVNDTDYYVGKEITASTTATWVGEGLDMYTVHLNKGANVIRLLSFASSDSSRVTWVNINCLFVQSGLTVLKANTSTLTLNAADATYVNNWEVKPEGRNILGNVGTKNAPMRNEKLTFANISQEKLSKLSYFAYTLNAPEAGYYDMSMLYNIGNKDYAGTGYYIVRVNGKYYKRQFKYYGDYYEDVNLSVYLEKGDNTVLVSSAIDVSSYYANGMGGYANWCDVSTLTINGGVTLSATQVDPETIEDDNLPPVTIDGETYAILNKYSISSTETGITSGKHIIGGMQQDAANLQSLASMQADGYFDKGPAPYASFLVKAEDKSTYSLTVDYRPHVNTDYSLSDYYMVISVNDKKYYKAFYNANPANSAWSKSTIEIELDAGVNTIRCISAVAETSAIISWLNIDCITLSGKRKVTPIAPNVTHLQSGQATYRNGFNSVRTGTSPAWQLSYVADYRGKSISYANGLTFDSLTSRNLKNLCYFAYTVDVPYDGYYDMQTYINTGAVGTGYLIMVVDGVKYKYNVKDTYKSIANNRNNLSCYFTAGSHTVVVSGIFDHTGYPNNNGATDWCDMGALTVSGGIVKSATQVDPATFTSGAETSNRGLILSSAYSCDSKYVIDGVSVNTTVDFFRSNFLASASASVTYNGTELSDSDYVLSGTVLDYGDGYSYTVGSIFGDINGDAVTDIRDLKGIKEFVFGDIVEIDANSANVIEDTAVNTNDVNEFRNTVLGKGDVINYQPISYGPSAILNYANPVGRLVEHKNAVFMESSASNFTISGYMKGDVKVQLFVENVKTDQYGIFIEIDGNDAKPYYKQLYGSTDMTVTVATGLEAGYHTIKISKSTDAKNDDIYVYSVTMNGTPMKTQPKKYKLEFVGTSLTTAYGSYDGRTLSYYSYANFTADALDADYYAVANGGWGFSVAGRNILDIYDDVSMNQDLGAYDFSYEPDIVVLNIGGNDGNNTAGCTTMLNLAREKNPNATIVYAYGLSGTAFSNNIADIKAQVAAFAKTDGNTYYCQLPANTDGIGGHPSVAGMHAAAVVLANYISDLMGWECNIINDYGNIS